MSNLLIQNNIIKRFAGRNKKESEYNYKLYVLSNRFKDGKEKKYYNKLLKASLNCNKIKNLPNIYDNEDSLVKLKKFSKNTVLDFYNDSIKSGINLLKQI